MKLSRMTRTGNPVGPGWSGYVVPPEMLRTCEVVPSAGALPLPGLRAEGSRVHRSDGALAWDRLAGQWRDLSAFGALYAASGDLGELIALCSQAGFPGNALALLAEYDAGGLDIRTKWVRKGRTELGIILPAAALWEDYDLTCPGTLPLGNRVTAGTGTVIISTTRQTSVQCSSGATAASYGVSQPSGYSSTLPAGAAASKWYLAGRTRAETAIDAAAAAWIGLEGPGGAYYITVGVNGGISATNFTVVTPGGALDTGVPIDTNWHEFEVWRVAGNVFCRIDGVAVGNVAIGVCAGACHVNVMATNGATAAARTISADWICLVSEAGQ